MKLLKQAEINHPNVSCISRIALKHTVARAKRRCMPTICALDTSNNASSVRRLILMRHAESEETGAVRDHDRQLTHAGRHAARIVGEQLRKIGWVPDVIVASNALRSRQTLDELRHVAPELEDADAHLLGSLYIISQLDGQTRSKLEEVVISEASIDNHCVLCIGSNKGWEQTASSFAGSIVKLGNCHAALLESSGANWTEAFEQENQWKLIDVLSPAKLIK